MEAVPKTPLLQHVQMHSGLQRRPGAGAAAESIDFEETVNRVSLAAAAQHSQEEERRRIYGYTGHTVSKVATTVVAGVAIGLTALVLQSGIELAVGLRNAGLKALMAQLGALAGLGAYAGGAAALVAATAAVVVLWEPQAAGAGVSLVMALLNGNRLPALLTPRVFGVKLLGTVASRAAGLALGPEGPMIHLGACVASMLCTLEQAVWRRLNYHATSNSMESIAKGDGYTPLPPGRSAPDAAAAAAAAPPPFSNADHRELVSAGAAAGLAAAFGAPVGGVLFALEEAATVWSRKTGWRCFLCAATATFTLAQLHPRSEFGMVSLRGIYPLTSLQWLVQLPFVVLASAGAGLLGAAFNLARAALWRAQGRGRRQRGGPAARIAGAAGVAAAAALLTTALAAGLGSCLPLPEGWDGTETVQYSCPAGQYNDLATALWGRSFWVIRALLGLGSETEPVNQLCTLRVPCCFSALSLLANCAAYLALMVASASLAVPGGLFMPSIMVGASFGALLGLVLMSVLPASWDIQPGLYALVAATAMLGGVFRSSISLVVIVVEGTRGIEFLFGIIVAVVVSNWVAHHLHPDGTYESELQRNGGVYFLRQEPPHALRSQSARNVMASPVVGFAALERAERIEELLAATPHNGYAVFDPASPLDPATGMGRLEGIILRSQLLVLLRQEAFCDERGSYLQEPPDTRGYEAALDAEMRAAQQVQQQGAAACLAPDAGDMALRFSPREEGGSLERLPSIGGSISDQLELAASTTNGGSGGTGGRYLNLLPFAACAPLVVRPDTPAPRVHQLFLALSLRHLPVVDARGYMLGIITRKDLDHAAGSGWWRLNTMAPTPRHAPPVPPPTAPLQHSNGWLSARRLVEALHQRLSSSPALASLVGSSPQAGLLATAEDEERGRRSGG